MRLGVRRVLLPWGLAGAALFRSGHGDQLNARGVKTPFTSSSPSLGGPSDSARARSLRVVHPESATSCRLCTPTIEVYGGETAPQPVTSFGCMAEVPSGPLAARLETGCAPGDLASNGFPLRCRIPVGAIVTTGRATAKARGPLKSASWKTPYIMSGDMPPRIPPPPFFSGISAMTASVVRTIAAIEAAFWSAERVILAGSTIPALNMSVYLLFRAS